MKKRKLNYLEYDIVSYCNLNCGGCSHFCNIDESKTIVTKEEYEKDLKRLQQFVNKIDIFRIMGGEPLLNPELSQIIRITFKYFKDSQIVLVTNALLFNKNMNELYNILKEYNVLVNISLYKENKEKLLEVIKILKERKINYFVEGSLNYFNKKILISKNEDVLDSYNNCSMKKCHNLSKGYLNICPIANYISRLNRRFNLNYPITSLNIHAQDLTIKKLETFLNNYNDMCNYCSKYPVYFKRKIVSYNDAKKDNYIIEGKIKLNHKLLYVIDHIYLLRKIKYLVYRVERKKYNN